MPNRSVRRWNRSLATDCRQGCERGTSFGPSMIPYPFQPTRRRSTMAAYGPGERVNHTAYGDGTVTSVNQYHIRIAFDVHGLKTFVSSRIVLASTSTPAPVRPKGQ